MIRHLIACAALLFAAATGNAFASVDANRASQAELETVKGIGPGLSGKILDARKTGDFKSWNDLVDRVGGVGPGNAAKFSQAGLTVAGTGYDSSAALAAPAKQAKKEIKAGEQKAGEHKAAEPKTSKTSKTMKDGGKPAAAL